MSGISRHHHRIRNGSGVNASLTIHSFRAGYATLLHKATKDLLLVARAMGHKDLSTTERYVRLDESVLREAVEKMFR